MDMEVNSTGISLMHFKGEVCDEVWIESLWTPGGLHGPQARDPMSHKARGTFPWVMPLSNTYV